MTVQTEINKANPNTLPDNVQRAVLGDGLAFNMARTEQLTVTANVATPSRPARQILRAYTTAGGTTGNLTVVAPEAAPAATQCAVTVAGAIALNAADVATEIEVTYIPVEGELYSETIPVLNATNLGTVNNGRGINQIVSATLVAPAATPGAKTPVARGTAAAAVGAGGCAVQDNGHDIAFLPAEVTADCTAVVSYYAFPGVGVGPNDTFGERLEAADSDDAGI